MTKNSETSEILAKITECFDIDNCKTLSDTKNALEKVIHLKHIHKLSISDNDKKILKDLIRRIRTKHIEIKDELNKQDIEFRKLELQL
jgi:hypothetical protein